MTEDLPMVLLTDRGEGKTTAALTWLQGGTRVPHYPGWDRVLVVSTHQEMMSIRRQWWSQVEDFDHRVYGLPDWSRALSVHPDTQVVLDNAEWMLTRLPGRVAPIGPDKQVPNTEAQDETSMITQDQRKTQFTIANPSLTDIVALLRETCTEDEVVIWLNAVNRDLPIVLGYSQRPISLCATGSGRRLVYEHVQSSSVEGMAAT